MSVNRDKILEQALKHELRGDTSATPACLDAETLAAWQDEALNAAQMEQVELHVSTCPRCQSMLAAFARGTVINPAVETARTPGTFSWWKWALAPLAAGAAAVLLWTVVPQQREVATRPPSPAAPAVVEQKKADAPAVELEARARAADSVVQQNQLKVAPRDERKQLKDQAAPAAKEEVPLAQIAPAAPPAPAALAAPTARAEAAGARVDELQKTARQAFAPTEIATPDRNVQWRIAGNRIERSEDAGKTWSVKHERLGENIVAGSAPSPSVAWFAGRAGIVILTTDAGATFAEVGIEEPLDIATVSATDARTAFISTVTGRRFQTGNGGRSWIAVQ